MKKTVLALSFALCASFAFAQTKKVTSVNRLAGNQAMESVSMDQIQEANFNASIFTKAENDTLHTWDFSTADQATTGIVSGTGDSTNFTWPDGTVVRYANHANTNDYTKWRRLTSYSDPILDNQGSYPGWSQRNADWRQANGFTMLEYRFDTARTGCTGHNGMMFMSMSESGPQENQPLNAYIDLGSVDLTGSPIVDLRLFQFYINYYDECFIDYKVGDATEWHTLPINVDGVDVDINASIWGWSSYTLPVAVANQNNVHLRLRYYSFKRGSAYGYWWALDDVMLIEGSEDRWERWNAQYVEGAYQTMPQGLDLPITWYAKVKNNGVNEKTNISTSIFNYNLNDDEATSIISATHPNVPADPTKQVAFVMDPAGWGTNADGTINNELNDPAYMGWYADARHVANATGKGLNTENAGINYAFSSVTSNSGEQGYDTIAYRVTEEENGDRVWGYDNGILSRFQFFGFGYTDDGYLTDTGHFANANYRVMNRYTTGPVVPEGWVLRGIEMVVNTEPGKIEPRAKLIPVVFTDEYDGESVSFNTVNTGAGEYEVSTEDFSSNNATLEGTGYLEPGDYSTIRIMFPEQPELEPYTSYRVGYQLAEAAQFAVAANTNRYYTKHNVQTEDGQTVSVDSVVFYREDNALKKFSSYFGTSHGYGLSQSYSTLIYEPQSPRASGWLFGQGLTGAPMIRAIVGPRQDIPTHNVTVNCEGNQDAGVATGTVQYGQQEDVCGSDVAIAEGSYPQFAIVPADGYVVSQITIDGQTVNMNSGNEEIQETASYDAVHYFGTNDDGTYYDWWVVELKDVRGARTINASYAAGEPQGIDPIAPTVRMKLQPNPATSQVRLSLSGVEGMVNCSLIDMSGRIVYNTTMNAENAEVIDLSNVAKGAYFVRITNNQFSKIEKLIVR